MLSEIFISDSFAQATQAAPQESSFSSLVPLCYFLLSYDQTGNEEK